MESPASVPVRSCSRRHRCAFPIVALIIVAAVTGGDLHAQLPPPYEQWGRESLEKIDEAFWIERRGLYSEESRLAGEKPEPGRQPAFMWGCGVQLSALVAAAKFDRKTYEPRMRAYGDALDAYWTNHKGIGGYDVLPNPRDADRYYDDNAWMVLAFAEAYEVSREHKQLDRAKKTMDFVLSGEDDKLGGGLYWRERELTSKNTCTNAPTIVGLLKLHQLTGRQDYLRKAHRIYVWTNEKLQDPEDGLYWDNINMEGKVDRRKFSYNSALMIRANCLIYEITKNRKYLDEARRIGESALKKWITPEGGVDDGGRFAHLLMGSFLTLAKVDNDPRWRQAVDRALRYVHTNVRDPNGHYADHWGRRQSGPLEKSAILDEASAARAYWEAAEMFRRP